MKNFIIAFGVFIVWSIFGLWIYSWLQPDNESAKLETDLNIVNPLIADQLNDELNTIKDSISGEIDTRNSPTESDILIKKEAERVTGLKATNDIGEIIFAFSEGISIKKNRPEIIIHQNSLEYKNKLKEYLIDHPDQELHICSLYSPMELVLSPNLGIQRANKISTQLIEAGIPKEKIVIRSIIKDLSFNEEDVFDNSIYFNFRPLDVSRIESIKNSIPETKVVYPKFTETGIVANKSLELLLNELIEYFSEHPNMTIDVVGHTDNVGNYNDNYSIGLKYSKQVRWYLISKGKLDGTLIKATSKGESEPIDDNYTNRGRIANKRIEIIFN